MMQRSGQPNKPGLLRFLSRKVGDGKQASVYEATDGYTRELVRLTDGVYGNRFVVKVIDYSDYEFKLDDDTKHSDMIHKLSMYQRIRDTDLAHVIPLVHWIAYFDEEHIVDKFNNKIEDVRKIPAGMLLMTFPLLDGVLYDLIWPRNYLALDQRKSICLQMIYIIQALHSIGIGHCDLHTENLMYTRLANGNYYLHAIDLDFAWDLDTNSRSQDYYYLFNNILEVMFGEDGIDKVRKHKELCKCLFEVANRMSDIADRVRAFNKLADVFNRTEFTEKDMED